MGRPRDPTVELKILNYLYEHRNQYSKRTQTQVIRCFRSRPRVSFALGYLVGRNMIDEKKYNPAYLYSITDLGLEVLKSGTPKNFFVVEDGVKPKHGKNQRGFPMTVTRQNPVG